MNDATVNPVESGAMEPEVKPAAVKPAVVPPAVEKPVEVPASVKPAVVPVVEKPVEVPAAVKPAEKPVAQKPAAAKPAAPKPAEKPAAAAKPDVAMEFRREFEQIKNSLAKQNEGNAAFMKQWGEYVQNIYKDVLPFFNRMSQSISQRVAGLDKRVFDAEKTLRALQDQSSTIASQQDALKEQSGTINKLQDCTARYQNDVLFKAQKEILEDLVLLSDQVRCNIQDQEQNKDYDTLLDSMKQIGKWIDASLGRSKMRKFEDCTDGTPSIDKKRQEVVETAETDVAEQDGCFVTRQPGYLWTIPFVGSVETMLSGNAPQAFEFVFRPEQVVKLKYIPKKKSKKSPS